MNEFWHWTNEINSLDIEKLITEIKIKPYVFDDRKYLFYSDKIMGIDFIIGKLRIHFRYGREVLRVERSDGSCVCYNIENFTHMKLLEKPKEFEL